MSRPRKRRKTRSQSSQYNAEMTAEADRFAQKRIREQLSTDPVNEPVVEDMLPRVYETAELEPPRHIHWLEGPLELIADLAREDSLIFVEDEYRDRMPHCVWDDAELDAVEIARIRGGPSGDVATSVDYRIRSLRQWIDCWVAWDSDTVGGNVGVKLPVR